MPDPIIITADDKRIRDLQAGLALLLSDFIAVDRPGWLTARRYSIQDVVDLLTPILPKQQASGGTENPDNAAGDDGDFYYKVPADYSSLTVYQKTAGVWEDVSLLDIQAFIDIASPPLADGVITPGAFTIDGTYKANFTTPFTYRLNGTQYTPSQTVLQLSPPDAVYVRIDIIVGDVNGNYVKVDGEAKLAYSAPDTPANTVVLAQIYRYTDGSNVIIINTTDGYVKKAGDSMFGRLALLNGSDLVSRAPLGNQGVGGIGRDCGDWVFQFGDGTEFRRLVANHFTGELYWMEEGDNDRKYDILNQKNATKNLYTTLEVADGTTTIDWQNAVAPGGDFTYVKKHGNDIRNITGVYLSGSAMTPYSPNYTYTTNVDGSINIVTISELFAGKINIL